MTRLQRLLMLPFPLQRYDIVEGAVKLDVLYPLIYLKDRTAGLEHPAPDTLSFGTARPVAGRCADGGRRCARHPRLRQCQIALAVDLLPRDGRRYARPLIKLVFVVASIAFASVHGAIAMARPEFACGLDTMEALP